MRVSQGFLDQVSFSVAGWSQGQAKHSLHLRGQDPKGNLRLRENPVSRINFLSLESSVFSVLWASRGTICSEMLLQPLQGCMLPPEPEMQTLSGAIAGATQDPNTHGLSKDPAERPESGHGDQGPAKKHSLESLKRLCNPSLI